RTVLHARQVEGEPVKKYSRGEGETGALAPKHSDAHARTTARERKETRCGEEGRVLADALTVDVERGAQVEVIAVVLLQQALQRQFLSHHALARTQLHAQPSALQHAAVEV